MFFGNGINPKVINGLFILLILFSLASMTNEEWIAILITLPAVIISITFHEYAHAAMAVHFGDNTPKAEGRLTLNPLAHIEPFTSIILPLTLFLIGAPVFGGAKPVPINTRNLKWGAWGMALVGIAGPVTNILLAFVAFLIGHFTGWMYVGGLLSFLFVQAVFVNLGFAVFNM